MRVSITVIFALFASLVLAQVPPSDQARDPIDDVIYAAEPDKTAKEAVMNIVRYTGLAPNFTIVAADVPTAIAYIKENKRYIAYNPDFIMEIEQQTRNRWGAVSVLAHEIGHHLSGHTLKGRGGNKADELMADKFSGFILYQMGANMEEARIALKTFGHTFDTIRHPELENRLEAITRGWQEARSLDDTKAFSQTEPPSLDEGKEEITFIFKCRFMNDDNVYFVDSKGRIILYDNYANPIVKGYIKPSETKNYMWYFYHNGSEYGVDAKGKMWYETSYSSAFVAGRVQPLRNLEDIKLDED